MPLISGRFPDACRIAVISRAVLSWSRPVKVSRRQTGVPAARLADSWRMRRSPPYLDKFIPANHLKSGTHLRTPNGQSAVVVGGSVPVVHDGWMWDLTVPGNNDHDFYVAVAATAVLVHNCTQGEKIANNIANHANGESAGRGWNPLC